MISAWTDIRTAECKIWIRIMAAKMGSSMIGIPGHSSSLFYPFDYSMDLSKSNLRRFFDVSVIDRLRSEKISQFPFAISQKAWFHSATAAVPVPWNGSILFDLLHFVMLMQCKEAIHH